MATLTVVSYLGIVMRGYSITRFISNAMNSDSRRVAGRAAGTTANTAFALGRLVELLAEKGLLDAADISIIAGEGCTLRIDELHRESEQ